MSQQQSGMNPASKIQDHMEVVGSNGQHFAIVDSVENGAIKLTKDANGHHHWIPMNWVTGVDQVVHLNRSGDAAMDEWMSSPPTTH